MADIIARLQSIERRDYKHHVPDVARDAIAEMETLRAALARERDGAQQLEQAIRFADEWLRGLPTLNAAQDEDRRAARKALRTTPVVRALLDE
jgi:hypothetical protein